MRTALSRGMFLFALATLGCSVPVANGLEEGDANRIVLALDRAGVDSTKDADPSVEGRFRVSVARDDAAQALAAMREEELPRPRARGVLDAMDKGALVPSQSMEHAQLVAGMAGELQKTLESIDGVLSARVHLNLPAQDALRDGASKAKATASVLLEHRGSTPPITADAVQRIVAGGAPGLAPADVAIVMLPRPPKVVPREAQLAHVGPIAVARGSMRMLQLGLAGLVVLVALLAGATLALYTRLGRLRAELQQASKK